MTPPDTAAWLANIRAELAAGCLLVTVQGKRGSIAIFKSDILGKSDAQLLEFILQRCSE